MSATLSLNNISMTYYTKTDETKAIDNLSFDVNKGEFVAIVGPSGCGKTTILSIIAGILKPTFGEVLLNGSKVEKVNNEVGYMLQHDHLFEWRTIYKNIILGLEIQKKSSPRLWLISKTCWKNTISRISKSIIPASFPAV